MFRHGELVYGLVVAVDIENFSRLDTLDQSMVQARLSQVLDLAAARACLDRKKWHRQLRGDGELAVLPPDTDVAWVVADSRTKSPRSSWTAVARGCGCGSRCTTAR